MTLPQIDMTAFRGTCSLQMQRAPSHTLSKLSQSTCLHVVVMEQDAALLRRCLPPRLWRQLALDFADTTPGTATALPKTKVSTQDTLPPFVVMWLASVLVRCGVLINDEHLTAARSPTRTSPRQLERTLGRIIVALNGLLSASQAPQAAGADTSAAWPSTLLICACLYWFQYALREVTSHKGSARATDMTHNRSKPPCTKTAVRAAKREAAELPVQRLRRLMLAHAARLAHPARAFETAVRACVPSDGATRLDVNEMPTTRVTLPKHTQTAAGNRTMRSDVVPSRVRRPARVTRRAPRSPSYSPTTSSASTEEDTESSSSDDEEEVTPERVPPRTAVSRPANSQTPTQRKKTARAPPAAPAPTPTCPSETEAQTLAELMLPPLRRRKH